ncbi:MAG TPA: response regulator transcription factor [Baekduia sp.]|uniref:response regulator transcription factor n=1 Tax=Baekduia sp. TaxID=2600305 RepID=UPI002D785E74|nr:response regulator transcription factor [Baekduia sp.]HET6510249.1 response regulator transcription factor [Baekduia sp.]
MRVLLAEDHPGVATSIATGLRRHGAAVDVAPDGGRALYLARVHPYDVVVLDRDLPEVHGDDVCRALNSERPDTKVLMLTAARGTDDIVEGLGLGADDYLLKPFRFAELVARVEALSRRAGSARPAVLERQGVRLDPARRAVTRDGAEVELARKEFGVLAELMGADGDVVSTEELLASVWDANVDPFSNIVRMTVMKLRRKLGAPNVIETVPGVGYRM